MRRAAAAAGAGRERGANWTEKMMGKEREGGVGVFFFIIKCGAHTFRNN